jgi:GT2 family glycosyltransferase
VVGRAVHLNEQATRLFKAIMPTYRVCLSNDVGVGILSFNRLGSIQRLLASIAQHTDLQRTVIFVSDESTQQEVKQWLRTVDWIVLLDNAERLGVAGNTNRILRCLSRFKHRLILNDDVEVLARGWEHFYPQAMNDTGMHHFCYRQIGIYGAAPNHASSTRNGRAIRTIYEKPQGAVMAFDEAAAGVVGYMDEGMGLYGMEHVDWSNRVWLSGIQMPGFHDVDGSERFFKMHQERSAMEDRTAHLAQARTRYEGLKADKARIFVQGTAKSVIGAMSCVIPCRGADRSASVDTVVACVKGQAFPAVEIIVVEQDDLERVRLTQYCRKMFIKAPAGQQFCKAVAFNRGVAASVHDRVVLQDADIIFHRQYFTKLHEILQSYEGCHVGKDLIYMDKNSTAEINRSARVIESMVSNKVVGYYEGGSLACTRRAYFACGGFLEDFIGYGCEDCNFFDRLKSGSKFYDARSETFIHLDHGRVAGWEQCHATNKRIHAALKAKHGGGLTRYCIERLRACGYEGTLAGLGIT